jgi:hypothetical protein
MYALDAIIHKKPTGSANIIPPGNKQNTAARAPNSKDTMPNTLSFFSILQNYQFFGSNGTPVNL